MESQPLRSFTPSIGSLRQWTAFAGTYGRIFRPRVAYLQHVGAGNFWRCNIHPFGPANYERVSCIILDVNLNDGSGIELRRGLKVAGIDVPVIYMTANDTPAVRTAALQSGCLAYLEKPFSAKSLIEPQASIGGLS